VISTTPGHPTARTTESSRLGNAQERLRRQAECRAERGQAVHQGSERVDAVCQGWAVTYGESTASIFGFEIITINVDDRLAESSCGSNLSYLTTPYTTLRLSPLPIISIYRRPYLPPLYLPPHTTLYYELLRRKQELLIRYNPLQGLSTEDRVTATAKRVGLSSPTGYVKGQEFGRGWAVKDESENGGGNEEGGR
jgi:hypothetical protein